VSLLIVHSTICADALREVLDASTARTLRTRTDGIEGVYGLAQVEPVFVLVLEVVAQSLAAVMGCCLEPAQSSPHLLIPRDEASEWSPRTYMVDMVPVRAEVPLLCGRSSVGRTSLVDPVAMAASLRRNCHDEEGEPIGYPVFAGALL
jgi:hypothetical protein